MTFIDLFSGGGFFREGMEQAGHKCLGYCEIDKYALEVYKKIHEPKLKEWYASDITKVKATEIPKSDIWCAGFPCQDISIAGTNRKGLSGERSGLFFTITRLIENTKEENRPKYLFFENVRNLLSINKGFDFVQLLSEMDKIGYDAEWQVINSSGYVPQSRQRIFIIGHSRNRRTRKVLPVTTPDGKACNELISGGQGERVYSPDGTSCTLKANSGGLGGKTGLYMFIDLSKYPKLCDIARTLIARYNKGITNRAGECSGIMYLSIITPERKNKRQNGRRIKDFYEPMYTLTTKDRHGVVELFKPKSLTIDDISNFILKYIKIRRLTPLECFRLQGMPDEKFFKAKQAIINKRPVSDTQLYKIAGNAVTVPVIKHIAIGFK